MATLESDKVRTALEVKLGCDTDDTDSHHIYFFVKDQNTCLSKTRMSKGSKHTLGEDLVSQMGKQLGLGGGGNLVKFQKCSISKEEAIQMIRTNLNIPAKKVVEPSAQPSSAARLKQK
jgi:hypothetical protein